MEQSVLEYPGALMCPELDDVLFVSKASQITLADALENLSDVPEVISVVTFGGCGEEVSCDIIV